MRSGYPPTKRIHGVGPCQDEAFGWVGGEWRVLGGGPVETSGSCSYGAVISVYFIQGCGADAVLTPSLVASDSRLCRSKRIACAVSAVAPCLRRTHVAAAQWLATLETRIIADAPSHRNSRRKDLDCWRHDMDRVDAKLDHGGWKPFHRRFWDRH